MKKKKIGGLNHVSCQVWSKPRSHSLLLRHPFQLLSIGADSSRKYLKVYHGQFLWTPLNRSWLTHQCFTRCWTFPILDPSSAPSLCLFCNRRRPCGAGLGQPWVVIWNPEGFLNALFPPAAFSALGLSRNLHVCHPFKLSHTPPGLTLKGLVCWTSSLLLCSLPQRRCEPLKDNTYLIL